MPSRLLRSMRYLWASPNSLLGLVLGLLFLCLGGRARIVQGALEIGGGHMGALLSCAPASLRFSAITLGHVIVGLSQRELETVRDHEHVHVKQCERWGPLFLPAYLLASLWQLLRGRRPYRDNPFEKQAYEHEHHGRHPSFHPPPPDRR